MLGKKIAIGTANFGSDYGHFNKTKLSKQKINKILKRCRLSNIDTVDTSSDYFKAEFFLGASGVKELKIISKIYVNEGLIKEQKKFLDKKIKKSLSDLKVKKLYALLFRKPENILDRSKIKIWQHAKNYQKEGIDWLLKADGRIMADDMGLGKTLQSIAAATQLIVEGEAKNILIICPSSLVRNWSDEFSKWAPNFCVQTITNTGSKKILFGRIYLIMRILQLQIMNKLEIYLKFYYIKR